MTQGQEIEQVVFMDNGVDNEYHRAEEPLVFDQVFNHVLQHKIIAPEIDPAKQDGAQYDNELVGYQQVMQQGEVFPGIDEFAQEDEVEKHAQALDHKIEVALEEVIKRYGGFIEIGVQEEQQAHEKGIAGIVQKLESSVEQEYRQ
jgi:hypothetical protein